MELFNKRVNKADYTTTNVADIEKPFAEVFKALDMKTQRKALKGAVRKESNRLKRVAMEEVMSSDIGKGTKEPLSKSLYSRVFPDRYGLGALVSVRPHGKRKGYHVNRYGKEKPVLMWAESGTRMRNVGKKVDYFTSRNRYTGKRTRNYIRGGASRGRMRKYEFLKHADEKAGGQTEENLFNEFKKNVYRAAERM
jgi:hypothetical protein